MLSAVVVSVSERQLPPRLQADLAVADGQSVLYATPNPDWLLLLNGSDAYNVSYQLQVDQSIRTTFASFNGISDNGVPGSIELLNADLPGRVNIASLDATGVADSSYVLRTFQVDSIGSTSFNFVGPDIDGPSLLTDSLSDTNASFDWSGFYSDGGDTVSLRPAGHDLDNLASYRIATHAVLFNLSSTPIVSSTPRPNKPPSEVVIQIETESVGLFETEAGQHVQQVLIRYLQPLIQSNVLVGSFHINHRLFSRWTVVSSVDSAVAQPTLTSGAVNPAHGTGEQTGREFANSWIVRQNTNENQSPHAEPINAISQMVSAAWHSPVEQLRSAATSPEASTATPLVGQRTHSRSRLTPSGTHPNGLLPAIAPNGSGLLAHRKTTSPIGQANSSRQVPANRDQKAVVNLETPWLAQFLMEVPRVERDSHDSTLNGSHHVVSTEPRFAIPPDPSNTQPTRKGPATLGPQAFLSESDGTIQSEDDRPREPEIQSTTLQQNRFEQGPRGPPSNDKIDSGFGLNRASQLRLQMLRHSQAPRSPSTVSNF